MFTKFFAGQKNFREVAKVVTPLTGEANPPLRCFVIFWEPIVIPSVAEESPWFFAKNCGDSSTDSE